jgi:hypothetical protein
VTEFQAGGNIPGITQAAKNFRMAYPEHYEEHAMGLFAHATRLKRVTLPDNMTEIPYAMFRDCESLEEIAIPESVKMVQPVAFERCPSKETVRRLMEARRARGLEAVWMEE